ncbi:MAG: leucine-rich repeat protein [Bacilli bacterium]|nr:leucine-rich repeat protein [Bacilli bacterium]
MKKLGLIAMPLMVVSFLASCGGNTPTPETKEYFVSFESFGGTHFGTQRIKDGNTAIEPSPEPVRDKDEFKGWFTDNETFQNKYTFTEPVTSDITLYAKWDKAPAVTYTVTFFNGGDVYRKVSGINSGSIIPEEKRPINPEDDPLGRTFLGWGTSYDGMHLVDLATTKFFENTSLYANWGYTVTWLNYDGTTLYKDPAPIGRKPRYRHYNPTRESDLFHDYSFAGWDHEFTEVFSDQTYVATYETHTYAATSVYMRIGGDKTIEEGIAISLDGDNNIIIWGDGVTEKIEGSSASHLYKIPDKYNVRILNPVYSISFGSLGRDAIEVLHVGKNIASIPDKAFSNCLNLSTVTFEDESNLKTIGKDAFYGCHSLESIAIPKGVTSIDGNVFAYCRSLSSITVDTENKIYEDKNSDVIIKKSTNTIMVGCNNSIIPESAISIGEEAFAGCASLAKIVISGNITSIANHAFVGCVSLIKITIPNNVISIGEEAFMGCLRLESIKISDGVLSVSIGDGAFSTCISLTDVVLSKSVTSIGKGAFAGCVSLPSIDIPDTIISINKGTFAGCSSLTDIVIPKSVTSIGEGAFAGCSSLTDITIINGITSISDAAFLGCSSITTLTIPNNVTSIGGAAFLGCSSLTSVDISRSVISIGSAAFVGCPKLTTLKVNSYNTVYTSQDKDKNERNAIMTADYKTLVAGCKRTTIPNSVTSIGEGAFAGCTSLADIIIPNSVKSIGAAAFINCDSLINITIPNSVVSIETAAFRSCRNLKTVNLTAFDFVPTLGEEAFSDWHENLKFYVKPDMVWRFKMAEGWSSYADMIFPATSFNKIV